MSNVKKCDRCGAIRTPTLFTQVLKSIRDENCLSIKLDGYDDFIIITHEEFNRICKFVEN